MPDYLAVALSIFVLMLGISLTWLCFWASLFMSNTIVHKDD